MAAKIRSDQRKICRVVPVVVSRAERERERDLVASATDAPQPTQESRRGPKKKRTAGDCDGNSGQGSGTMFTMIPLFSPSSTLQSGS